MNLNYKNFDLCCRTCLRDDSEELYEIFQKDANGTVDIAELISTYTSIQVRYFLFPLHLVGNDIKKIPTNFFKK